MRRRDEGAALDAAQAAAADRGLKAMIPAAGGRPFLDYVLSSLADAWWREVCLVIGPEHEEVRSYYATVGPRRVRIAFAVQQQPCGTADAVLAAEEFTAGEPFLVLNSDNLYPVEALAALGQIDGPGLPGFDPRVLVAEGGIPEARLAQFALLDVGRDGILRRIVEKPDAATAARFGGDTLVSMNVWRFTPEIFRACRDVTPSPRGELELPAAVQLAIDRDGMRFQVLPFHAGVLDLSTRGDVAAVVSRLRHVTVDL